MNKITFDINNQGIMTLSQNEHDGELILITRNSREKEESWTISPGDMAMLMNYYRIQKDSNELIL